jgi:uncharacterized protein YcbK (DUF882 family)
VIDALDWSWPNFTPAEVLSPAGLDYLERTGICLVRSEALDLLQAFRSDLGVKMRVNHGDMKLRGYRFFYENQGLPNSSDYSQHVQGVAFDVSCYEIDNTSLYEQALDFGWTGIGLYDTFVHMDIRHSPSGKRFTWDARRN